MSMNPSRRVLDSLTLADLAVDNRVFMVRCHLCRKTEHYLASDLALVLGDDHKVNDAFSACPHCGKSEYLNVQHRLVSYDDEGRLQLRRPVAKRVWRWTDAVYQKSV